MKKQLMTITIVLALFVFGVSSALAKKYVVNVQNYSFSPSTLEGVSIGDTIRWVWVSGTHTTTSTTIPEGAPTWNSAISSTVPSFEYVVTTAGTYNYKCTPHAAMGMTGSFTVTSSLSVGEKQAKVFSIYPNPARDYININLEGNDGKAADVYLVNSAGRAVYHDRFAAQSTRGIDVSSLPDGTYLVRVAKGFNTGVQKVEVIH